MNTDSNGLEGIVVAETELSDVDGERGHLVLRGYLIEELVGQVTFEDVCALLWTGHLLSSSERQDWTSRLGRARQDAFNMLPSMGAALALPDGMDALRAALSHLSPAGEFEKDSLAATGATAVFAAAWARLRNKQPPVAPQATLSHAADYLHMITGRTPSSAHVDALDAYLCCVADHGLNASTLAARVVASTGSDLISAVVAGIGALKGPLHGGAPGPVLDMLDAIGSPEHARAWLTAELSAGNRIMGWDTACTESEILARPRWSTRRQSWRHQARRDAGSAWPEWSSARPKRSSPSVIRNESCVQTSSFTPPFCSTGLAFPARCSHQHSRSPACRAGVHMWMSNAAAGG